MNFNVPYRIRLGLYILTAVGTVVIGYLFEKNLIGDDELGLWGGLVAVVNSMAALNTKPNTGEL